MSPIRPEVAARFPAWTAQFEGYEDHLYLDAEGLPTTGRGYLVSTLTAMLRLPWLCESGEPASEEQIRAEWARVTSMPRSLRASAYRVSGGIHLSGETIDATTRERLEANARVLLTYFPDFASWPASAQTGALSMAWAMGAGFPAKYLRFSAAARRRDWATCADECLMHGVGLDRRNAADRELFLAAAEGR